MGTTDPWKAFAKSETTSWDASLFSSSLPVLLHEKLKLNHRENGSSESIDDLSCGNLNDGDDLALSSGFLPDDENELLAGVMDDFDLSGLPVSLEDLDDDDIFDSSGGMELEPDQQEILSEEISKMSISDGAFRNNAVPQYAFSNGTGGGTISGEHPFGEHPSRTLFVRNINSNVEDLELKSLFEQYGAIRNMYTACKHRGFVMISYYDIRDARNAMRALQNKPLRRRKLDIHFSIPKDNPSDKDINQGTLVIFNLDPSVSSEELLKIFSTCGEVKEIRETPQKRHHKFIEYYDVRAAEVALKSLNGCEISGKRIKLEPSRPGGARKTIMFQLNPELEQDDYRSFLHQMSSPIANSPPGSWMQFGSPIENRALQNLGQIPGVFKSNSPTYNSSHLPGLASILPSQVSNSLKIAPIGMKQQYGGFQHAHSLPTQKLNEYHGSVSSFGHSTSNGSVETLSGPQFLWGNPNPYMDSPGSSSNSHNVSLSGHFTSFLGKATASTQSHHVVGSAPPGYPLNRQFDHFSESPEASFMGSAAAFGVGSSVKVNPRGGNLFESNNNFPIPSPPRLNPVFLGGGMYPSFSPTGMEGLNRARRMESARSEVESKKLFHIDLDKILIGEDSRTTLMIKNIPNKYTSKMLLASIDENHKGTYDFLYLPIDFKNKCNVGYAFINMLSPSHIIPFYEEFNGKRWEKFNSEKVAYLAYARIQGKAALISHFQNSSLMNEDKRCRPILFYSDGSGPINQDIFIPSLDIQTEHHQTLGGSESVFS